MCPICWISGFVAILFGGSFIAAVNHPISWVIGFLFIAYSIYQFYQARERGKKMTTEAKKRNKRLIIRFVQGAVIGSIVTITIFYSFTHKEHEKMHQLLKEHGIEEHSH